MRCPVHCPFSQLHVCEEACPRALTSPPNASVSPAGREGTGQSTGGLCRRYVCLLRLPVLPVLRDGMAVLLYTVLTCDVDYRYVV